jgi:hypothetical protein
MKKFLLLLIFGISVPFLGQNGKFSGYMMGDYYYNIEHHNATIKGQNGFWFRRIYFTYDYKIDKSFSTRLRLEMNNDGKYTSTIALIPVVKDAYLQYKFGKQKATFGIAPTPTFSLIEKVWGYRSVEKTLLDLQRMASSRDFGVSISGKLNKLGYHAMIANGSSNKQEIDKGKSIMLAISYWFAKDIVLEIYGDYANRAEKADTYIAQGFLGYKTKTFHGGIQYSTQTLISKDENLNDINLNALSLFAAGNIFERIKLIGRIDRMFNANPVGDKIAYTPYSTKAAFTMFLIGTDISAVKDVSIIPNFTYVLYDKNETTYSNDLYGRLTFYWKFK